VKPDFGDLSERSRQLIVLHGVLETDVGKALIRLLEECATPSGAGGRLYATLFRLLAEEAERADRTYPGNAWQRFLLSKILSDDNVYSRIVHRHGPTAAGDSLDGAMRHDLGILDDLAALDPYHVEAAASPDRSMPSWADLSPMPGCPGLEPDTAQLCKSLLVAAGSARNSALATGGWAGLLPDVAHHYATRGAGLFSSFYAFRWIHYDRQGRLEGIESPDPVRLASLFGYESQRQLLIQNTEQFLAGLPANNVLLYGDRGTGKSSTIKAILNEYRAVGLRMIEVTQSGLDDFGDIVHLLQGRPQKFILFIDDLSFEETETHYKGLKAILEGSLQARPPNVLLYASSNRRHLIKERFADRATPADDDVQAQDTVQEKLSLSDRFGITLTYLQPDQEQYLAIVTGIARARGVDISLKTLRLRALQWATWHNGRGGRTARQFVDHLEGERGLARTFAPGAPIPD
jgi:predicted AAA+ superfamily ATPase